MFKIQAEPTFNARVDIPVAGKPSVPVILTFKHRTKDELDAWRKECEGMDEVDVFMGCVVGWVDNDKEAKAIDKEAHGIEEAFTKENVQALLQQRIGTSMAAYVKYAEELLKHREKN